MIFLASSNGQARLSAAAASISGLKSMLAERAMTGLSRCLVDFLPASPGFAGNALWNQSGYVNATRVFRCGPAGGPLVTASIKGEGNEEADCPRGADLSDG